MPLKLLEKTEKEREIPGFSSFFKYLSFIKTRFLSLAFCFYLQYFTVHIYIYIYSKVEAKVCEKN